MTLVHFLGTPWARWEEMVSWAELIAIGAIGRTSYDTDIIKQGAVPFSEWSSRALDAAADDERSILAEISVAERNGSISRTEAIQLTMEVFSAGVLTTAGLISNCILALTQRNDLADQLRSDFALIPGFIEEVLRLESPVQGVFRLAMRDCEVGGFPISEGSRVFVLFGAANRDSHAWTGADDFDMRRPGSPAHLAFGRGVHTCPGSSLSRTETRIALETILAHTTSMDLAVGVHEVEYLPNPIFRIPLQLPLEVLRPRHSIRVREPFASFPQGKNAGQ
ncbi:cytochrome P450 [Streptomyces sp. NPDC051909]|uniref:cytochrome P450 n=1 Tax=Streptomyces sp. NPDC051909 TaxID=3154944 RepID=UPI0034281F22